MGLDDFFQQLGQKYFTPAVWQAGLRMFQKGKTIISFKRGDPDNYSIVSGIINEAEC
ncbi:MAG: hypothetical protein J6Y94_07140 [Bacteriovoracaceae bacterium]|nr:hypothetical protein [Bacteriovoracaceae bacterium]